MGTKTASTETKLDISDAFYLAVATVIDTEQRLGRSARTFTDADRAELRARVRRELAEAGW